jgi:sugar lactone lactonase YvrE
MPGIKIIGTVSLLLILMLQAIGAFAQSTESAEPVTKTQSTAKKEQSIAELEERSRQAYEEENWVRYYGANIRMMNQRPFEPVYMQRVIGACALLGRMKTAFHYMLRMQQMGLAYDLSEDPDTQSLRHTEVFTYINDQLIAAGEPMGTADTVFDLPSNYPDPTALSWDASRNRFLVGTESEGVILAVAEDGSSEVLMQADDENGLWAIRGLHADAQSNRLWVSSAAVPEFSAYVPTEKGRSALFEIELDTLKVLRRFNVPVDGLSHTFGPLAVTAAGDVYVIDHANSRVYLKPAGLNGLEVFIGSDEMKSLSSIVVSPDNSRMYLADLYKGVLAINPVERASTILSGPEHTNFGGIVSMSYAPDKLFIVQNGFQPEGVVQFGLDPTGGLVTSRMPVATALPELNRPGLSMVKDDLVYYFANLGTPAEGSPSNGTVQLNRSPMPVVQMAPGLNSPPGSRPADQE